MSQVVLKSNCGPFFKSLLQYPLPSNFFSPKNTVETLNLDGTPQVNNSAYNQLLKYNKSTNSSDFMLSSFKLVDLTTYHPELKLKNNVLVPSGHEFLICGSTKALEEDLMYIFLKEFNPLLNYAIQPQHIDSILSINPNTQDVFLYFSMCTCAALLYKFRTNKISLEFYSIAIEFMCNPGLVRDGNFMLGMRIMQFIKNKLECN